MCGMFVSIYILYWHSSRTLWLTSAIAAGPGLRGRLVADLGLPGLVQREPLPAGCWEVLLRPEGLDGIERLFIVHLAC